MQVGQEQTQTALRFKISNQQSEETRERYLPLKKTGKGEIRKHSKNLQIIKEKKQPKRKCFLQKKHPEPAPGWVSSAAGDSAPASPGFGKPHLQMTVVSLCLFTPSSL